MMIVSNQIETGKVQYVWMAFSHQTAPRSGSSLNISQILLFSNVPLLSSKYRLFHNCPKRKKYFYTIVAGAEQKLFRLWVGGRYSICIFCGTGGLVFPWYFLYGLVEGILFPDHMSDTCHIHHFSIFISTYRFFFFNLFQSNGQKTMRNVMINIFITFNMYLAILAIVLYYMVLHCIVWHLTVLHGIVLLGIVSYYGIMVFTWDGGELCWGWCQIGLPFPL